MRFNPKKPSLFKNTWQAIAPEKNPFWMQKHPIIQYQLLRNLISATTIALLSLTLTACIPATFSFESATDFPERNAPLLIANESTLIADDCLTTSPETAETIIEIESEVGLPITPEENDIIANEEITVPEIPLPSDEEISSFESQEGQTTELPPVTDEDVVNVEPDIIYDYPMAMNKKVEFFLNHFQNKQPKNFKKWLSRSTRYLPMIHKELEKAGMPLDLAYLPMIESGYRLTAYSRARATGPWQFIRSTARMYGLRIDNYIDERRDPVKSTQAAISFLKDLYEELDSWHLATAAYNGGSGRIRKAIRKTGSRDFWDLASSNYLKRETKYYVPKLIAAIMIAKDPEQYGFTDIEYEPPLEYEILEVPRWTTLQAVAVAGDMDFEELRNLNRQLRRVITPPGTKLYPLKVPPSKKELIAANLPRVNAVITTNYKIHVVRKGDTLTRICNTYNINKTTLLKANNLRSAKLAKGQRLRIPYKTTRYKLLSKSQLARTIAPAEMAPENLVLHKVKPGETISELARRYNVPMHMIAGWNGLNNLNSLRAGQQLAFYLQDLEDHDDRLASLSDSKKNSVPETSSSATLKGLSGSRSGSIIPINAKSKLTYYQVKGGDSLWAIAEKFRTTPAKIRQWNSLEDNVIYPGHKLLLRVIKDIDA